MDGASVLAANDARNQRREGTGEAKRQGGGEAFMSTLGSGKAEVSLLALLYSFCYTADFLNRCSTCSTGIKSGTHSIDHTSTVLQGIGGTAKSTTSGTL